MPTSARSRTARTAAIGALLAAVGLTAGLWTPPPAAVACSCLPPPPPLQAMATADAVVRGTVAALAADGEGISVTLRVRTVWKGPAGPRISVRTATNSAACGYPFQLGADTIVYAHADAAGDPDRFDTTSCDRTAPFDAVEAAALGAPSAEHPWVDPPVPNCPRCPIASAEGALAGADVAFLGQPLRIEDAGPEGDWARRVRFRVLGVWKGDPPAIVDVVAPYLAWACRGQHWLDDAAGALVFAQRSPDGGLAMSICGRLERYDPADVASLGPMTPAPTAGASPTPTRESTVAPTVPPDATATASSTAIQPAPGQRLFVPLAERPTR